MPRPRRTLSKQKKRQYLLLLAPGCLLYGLFNLIPILTLPALSLFSWPGIGEMHFVGLSHYMELLGKSYFRGQLLNALLNNTVYFALLITFFLTVGTLLTVLTVFVKRGAQHYRLLFFLPYPMAGAAVAYLGGLIVQARGPLNKFLIETGMIDRAIAFLGSPDAALPTLAGFYAWHRMGFVVLLLFAAICAIKKDLIDAALVDGAARWQVLRYVILPGMLSSYIVITLIIMVDVFNSADNTLILMGAEAGPMRSTDTMATYLFRNAFGGTSSGSHADFGVAASIGVISMLCILPAVWYLAKKHGQQDQ